MKRLFQGLAVTFSFGTYIGVALRVGTFTIPQGISLGIGTALVFSILALSERTNA